MNFEFQLFDGRDSSTLITNSDWTEISDLLDFDCLSSSALGKRKAMTELNSTRSEAADAPSKKTKRSDSTSSQNESTIRKQRFTDSKDLPDPKNESKPIVFLQDLVEAMFGYRPEVKAGLKLDSYCPEITEEQIAAYDMEVTTAARNNDLDVLRRLHSKGTTMNCSNRFGESLLHMACRRGFVDLGKFLLQEANLEVRISDDCGRNPFHDIFWNPKVETDLAKLILERDPTLLLVADKRGHTPFDYARPRDYMTWRQFIFDHKELLEPLDGEAVREVFQ